MYSLLIFIGMVSLFSTSALNSHLAQPLFHNQYFCNTLGEGNWQFNSIKIILTSQTTSRASRVAGVCWSHFENHGTGQINSCSWPVVSHHTVSTRWQGFIYSYIDSNWDRRDSIHLWWSFNPPSLNPKPKSERFAFISDLGHICSRSSLETTVG